MHHIHESHPCVTRGKYGDTCTKLGIFECGLSLAFRTTHNPETPHSPCHCSTTVPPYHTHCSAVLLCSCAAAVLLYWCTSILQWFVLVVPHAGQSRLFVRPASDSPVRLFFGTKDKRQKIGPNPQNGRQEKKKKWLSQ